MLKTRSLAAFTAILVMASCSNLRYVNPFLGTAGDHGQMTPGAAVPFGSINVCPDSDPGQHGGYDYWVPQISGISINRVSGVGCNGTGGNISVLPGYANLDQAGGKPVQEDTLRIVKGSEKARPGYYAATLSNGVKLRLTATRNVALEEYDYAALDGEKLMTIDFNSSVDRRKVSSIWQAKDSSAIWGFVNSPTACARGSYRLHFHISFSEPFSIEEISPSAVRLRFADKTRKVQLRVATSPVSMESAENENALMADKSFDATAAEALALWKEKLERIDVKGSTKDQKTIFYTSLYRLYHSPMIVMDSDSTFRTTNGALRRSSHEYYSSWSMWDTYRTKFPLLTILEPEAMEDICWSAAQHYLYGKRNWATPHECAPTVRTEHTIMMLQDALYKGIEFGDLERYVPGMLDEAAKDYLVTSLDQKLESSNDFWSLSRLLSHIGKDSLATHYGAVADSLFINSWKENFAEVTPTFHVMRANGLYQGSLWQYRWSCPQYASQMSEIVGQEKLVEELEYFFDNHLFNQGNEPDLQCPFFFNALGRPDLTAKTVRELLTKEDMVHVYGGTFEYPEPFIGRAFQNKVDGFAPEMDEDDGAMSAWYIFASAGLYPLCVGVPEYELFAPLYDKISFNLDGHKVNFICRGRKSPEDRVKEIRLDGEVLSGTTLPHSAFLKDSTVEFIF